MADNKTLITEALRSIKLLDAFPAATKETTDKLQKYFRDKSVELTVITKFIAESEKDSSDYDRHITAAEKTLAALEKTKADPATAKKLDASIKSASLALKALRTNLATYAKFADQAEKDDTKIEKIAAELLKLGEPTLKTLAAANITLPNQPLSVQEAFDKQWPKQVVLKSFAQVGAELRAVKEVIAKGEIFNSSADTLLSKRKDAFAPGTVAACGKIDTLKTAMETQLAKVRQPYDKAINDMQNFGTMLKNMP